MEIAKRARSRQLGLSFVLQVDVDEMTPSLWLIILTLIPENDLVSDIRGM
jgi:hypothetical protein